MKISKNDILNKANNNNVDVLLAKGEQDNREYYAQVGRDRLANDEDKLKAFKDAHLGDSTEYAYLEDALNNHKPITFFGTSTTGLLKGKDSVYRDEDGVDHLIKNRYDEPFLLVAKTFVYNEQANDYRLSDYLYVPFEVTNKELLTACVCDARNGKYDVFAQASVNKDGYFAGVGVMAHDKAVELINAYFEEHSDAENVCYTDFHAEMLDLIGVDMDSLIDMEKVVASLNRDDKFLFENRGRTTLNAVSKELLGYTPTDTIEKLDCQVGIMEYLAKERLHLEKPAQFRDMELLLDKQENTVNHKVMYDYLYRPIYSFHELHGIERNEEVKVAPTTANQSVEDEFMANFGFDMSDFGDTFAETTEATKTAEPVIEAFDMGDFETEEMPDFDYEEDDSFYDDFDYDFYEQDLDDYAFDRQYEEQIQEVNKMEIYNKEKEQTKEAVAIAKTPDYSTSFEALVKNLSAQNEILQKSLVASEERNRILEKQNEELTKIVQLIDNFSKIYSAKEIEGRGTDDKDNKGMQAFVELAKDGVSLKDIG